MYIYVILDNFITLIVQDINVLIDNIKLYSLTLKSINCSSQ